MGPNSDVDLLVFKGGRFNRCKSVVEIYRHMHGVSQAVDIIIVTPEEVERYRGRKTSFPSELDRLDILILNGSMIVFIQGLAGRIMQPGNFQRSIWLSSETM